MVTEKKSTQQTDNAGKSAKESGQEQQTAKTEKPVLVSSYTDRLRYRISNHRAGIFLPGVKLLVWESFKLLLLGWLLF